MLDNKLSRFLLLPELKLTSLSVGSDRNLYLSEKARSEFEICPKCASPCRTVYDHRWVKIKDEPLRNKPVTLKIRKRRFWCKQCRKPFTEPVQGIMPRSRSTQRLKRAVARACEDYADLKRVQKRFFVSSGFVYKCFYQGLELKLRELNYPWPKSIGIDEHFFSRRKGYSEFATVVTDMTNKRLKACVLGKTRDDVRKGLEHIPGRENVLWATCDLSDTYKGFIFQYFPNAQIVADKFHVLRLLHPHLIRRRKDIAPSRMNAKAKKLFTMSSKKLDYWDRKTIWNFLDKYPELKEIYAWKERLFGLYRIKGYNKAKRALEKMLDEMKLSILPEIRRLYRTLSKWSQEVLNYFKNRLTNARTEGFNNIAKLVQKRAFGYKNFENYSRRVLTACSHSRF